MSDLDSRKAFAEYLEEVARQARDLNEGDGGCVWYRGQPRRDYTLLPSLYRSSVSDIQLPGEELSSGHLYRLESDLYFEFQAQAFNLDHADLSSWALLFLMRHYGLPTRTLDWSETLGVAIYFALSPDDPRELERPTIWLLNPVMLNSAACGCEGSIVPASIFRWVWGPDDLASAFSRRLHNRLGVHPHQLEYSDVLEMRLQSRFATELPLAIYPSRRNERMLAQQGTFTMHCASPKPLEELCAACVRKVPMPDEAIAGARRFLKESGTTPRVMFPGLDGLSREMRAKYSASRRSTPTA